MNIDFIFAMMSLAGAALSGAFLPQLVIWRTMYYRGRKIDCNRKLWIPIFSTILLISCYYMFVKNLYPILIFSGCVFILCLFCCVIAPLSSEER